MIEAHDIGFCIPDGPWLWRNLNLTLKTGSVTGIIGRNGSGKTTLIRVLLGLIKPHEGHVIHRGAAGYVPQSTEISLPFSVREVVAMGRARHVRLFSSLNRHDRRTIDRAMACTGVADFADRSFHTLSGGERQLVLIARAVAAECDVLALDEPFTGLDLENQCVTLSLIRRLAEEDGLSILFSAHHPDHLFAVAEQALILKKGGIGIIGPTADELTPDRLSRLYGVDVRVIDMPRAGGESRHAVPYLRA